MQIREITSIEDILTNYQLVVQLYGKEITHTDYQALIPQLIEHGYRQVGLFDQDYCIGFIGFHQSVHLTCGKYLYIDDLVISLQHRTAGFSKLLLNWVEEEAVRLHCKTVLLDCFVENKLPQKLYHQQGYEILAFHFGKKL